MSSNVWGVIALVLVGALGCGGGQPCAGSGDCNAGEYCAADFSCRSGNRRSVSTAASSASAQAPAPAAVPGEVPVPGDGIEPRITGTIGPRGGLDVPGNLTVTPESGWETIVVDNPSEHILVLAHLPVTLLDGPAGTVRATGGQLQGCSGMDQTPYYDAMARDPEVTIVDSEEGRVIEVTARLEGAGRATTIRFPRTAP